MYFIIIVIFIICIYLNSENGFFWYVYELLRSYSSIDINIIYNTITSLKQILYFAQLLSVYILLCFYSSVCPDADGAAAALVDLWPDSYFNLLYDLLSSSNCRTVWLCQSWLWLLTDFGLRVCVCVFPGTSWFARTQRSSWNPWTSCE